MVKYRLLSDAKKDLREIWNYTVDKWGEQQGVDYLKIIEDCFEDISGNAIFYKQFSPNSEIKYTRCEHHYVIFLLESKPIILAILHEKMDLLSVLKKRLPTLL